MHRLIAPRDQKYQSNFVEFRSLKIVYRRYAGLFFCVCVDANDNELSYLEAIHFFVEVLDSFFGNVCELDLVFNFWKVSVGVWWALNKLAAFCWGRGWKGLRGGDDVVYMWRCRLTFGGIRSMRFSTKSSLPGKSRRPVNRLC